MKKEVAVGNISRKDNNISGNQGDKPMSQNSANMIALENTTAISAASGSLKWQRHPWFLKYLEENSLWIKSKYILYCDISIVVTVAFPGCFLSLCSLHTVYCMLWGVNKGYK